VESREKVELLLLREPHDQRQRVLTLQLLNTSKNSREVLQNHLKKIANTPRQGECTCVCLCFRQGRPDVARTEETHGVPLFNFGGRWRL